MAHFLDVGPCSNEFSSPLDRAGSDGPVEQSGRPSGARFWDVGHNAMFYKPGLEDGGCTPFNVLREEQDPAGIRNGCCACKQSNNNRVDALPRAVLIAQKVGGLLCKPSKSREASGSVVGVVGEGNEGAGVLQCQCQRSDGFGMTPGFDRLVTDSQKALKSCCGIDRLVTDSKTVLQSCSEMQIPNSIPPVKKGRNSKITILAQGPEQ